MSRRARVIALLGAESTGKTTLAGDLARCLADRGRDVVQVSEYLRDWCNKHGRTPRIDEQSLIAEAQTARIGEAALDHDWVIADTSAVMTAVYSEIVFGDVSLYDSALAAHAEGCDFTLLTALDLPWEADGPMRDGPHVREPVDALIRAALARAGIGFSVVFGTGTRRLEAALAGIDRGLSPPPERGPGRWQFHCERCGDPDCERHGLTA